MIKLLRAGVHRYLKSPLFAICVLLSLGLGTWFGIHLYNEPYFSEGHMWLVIFELAVIAVFVSLTVGTEYAHGGLRRKIVSGASRERIFFSELLVTVAAVTLFYLLYGATVALINTRLIANFTPELLFLLVVGMWLCNISFAVAVLAVAILVPSRVISAVLALLMLLGMLVWNDSIGARLDQPAEWESFHYDEELDTFVPERQENPNYIRPPLRTVLTAVNNALPTSQLLIHSTALHPYFYSEEAIEQAQIEGAPFNKDRFQAISAEELHTMRTLPLYSLGEILLLVLAGVLIFRRRSLR